MHCGLQRFSALEIKFFRKYLGKIVLVVSYFTAPLKFSTMKSKQLVAYCLMAGLTIGLVALVGLFTPRKGEGNATATCAYQVCMARFGYHSMLIIPAENRLYSWRGRFSGVDQTIQYVGVGWGERTWYVDPPSSSVAQLIQGTRALLLPNASIIKIQRYSDFPEHYQTECIGVTPNHYLQLIAFIQQTFLTDAKNQPILVTTDKELNATFYEAKGTYSLFNNSNHWTARGLQVAGADTPLWAAHAVALMHVLQPTCAKPSASE